MSEFESPFSLEADDKMHLEQDNNPFDDMRHYDKMSTTELFDILDDDDNKMTVSDQETEIKEG